ncbi:MAG TPA: hypothetical protein VNO26_03510 [Candidatus Limnocylindria bacterium]|nr:hypothetical protein [Candidatus Limnocylindria bacterium]
MKRLELGEIRICRRCGRGRATLITDDGETLAIPLDPARARTLRAPETESEMPWLSALVLERLTQDGGTLEDVVLDVDQGLLRALVSCRRGEEQEIVACTPQEGVDLANRSGAALYATDEALAFAAGARARSGETLH